MNQILRGNNMDLTHEDYIKMKKYFNNQVIDASTNVKFSISQTFEYKCGYERALIDCLQFFENVYINKDKL